MRRLATSLGEAFLGAVLPPLCVGCGEVSATPHGVCAACWAKLDFIAEPRCACCGVPFPYDVSGLNGETLCGACLIERPLFEIARAPLQYTSESKALVLPFKHHDRTDLAPALANMMAQHAPALVQQSDLVVPVPLHFMRLFTRRYNQAALLATHIAKQARLPFHLMALTRPKPTPSQGRLTRRERFLNIKNAFRVPEKFKSAVAGKNILLIDDVMTTGATANACTGALLKAGAKAVRVLTLARVTREHD